MGYRPLSNIKLNLNSGSRISSLTVSLVVAGRLATAAALPVIEMPKYVITGVEQATALSGKKIPTLTSAKFLVPESTPEVRPALSLEILDSPTDSPLLLRPVGGGYTEVEAATGAFGFAKGRFITAGEGDLTGYLVAAGVERFPMRNATGPKLDGFAKGSGVRWFGKETTIAPGFEANQSTFVRKGVPDSETNSHFSFCLNASMTPVQLFDGRLKSLFQFDLNMLDNRRNLSASHDRLVLDYSRAAWRGWLESRIELEVEAVSVDKESHSLYSIKSIYTEPIGDRLIWRGGLTAYTGNVILQPAFGDSGHSENRNGAGLLSGFTWQATSEGTLDIDFWSQPRFESFGKLFREMMLLDSTARGVTVESPVALSICYSNLLGATTKLRLSATTSSERHRPFWIAAPDGNWRITTRSAKATTGKAELELEPLSRLGVTLYGSFTSATSSGSDNGSQAPFMSPSEIGCDAILQVGKVVVDGKLSLKSGTPIDFSSDLRSPDIAGLDVSAHWLVRSGLTGSIGVDNLLNHRQWEIPGYDLNPMTIWVGINWRSGQGVW